MTRPLSRRAAALLLLGGILVSSTAAGVHDPGCPHHAAGASHGASAGGAMSGHQGGAPGHGGSEGGGPDGMHAVQGHRTADAEAPRGDCRCLGGICALTAVADPPKPVLAPVFRSPSIHTLAPAPAGHGVTVGSPRHLLPPHTGPPLAG